MPKLFFFFSPSLANGHKAEHYYPARTGKKWQNKHILKQSVSWDGNKWEQYFPPLISLDSHFYDRKHVPAGAESRIPFNSTRGEYNDIKGCKNFRDGHHWRLALTAQLWWICASEPAQSPPSQPSPPKKWNQAEILFSLCDNVQFKHSVLSRKWFFYSSLSSLQHLTDKPM